MFQPSVSIIINTHNRANHLKRLLDCLNYQTYKNFEVIVVNGPSTDHTDKILEQYKDFIRLETCPEVNLCMSRNIGVRAAAGEIIAFIDDDAVPENKKWIENAVACFADEEIGVVGGSVLRIGGQIEFQYGYFSIWGDNSSYSDFPLSDLEPGWYRGCAGGNVFFRKSAVIAVGGFDEYYVYYMDETDLCMRVAQAGFRVEYGEHMEIIHEAAKSANRKSKYNLNWDVIARSRAYFTMKATEDTGETVRVREKRAAETCDNWLKEFKDWYRNGYITKEEFKTFTNMIQEGIAEGIADAKTKRRQLDQNLGQVKNIFKPFMIPCRSLNICFLCEDDIINPMGGVPVYTHALAYGLAKKGHNIYVISRGKEEILTNVDGINICYVSPTELDISEVEFEPISKKRLQFSYACYQKLQQLKRSFFIDVLETPIWDTYGLVSSYCETEIPMATRLQTPLKMVMDTFQKENSSDLSLLMEYEAAMMDHSDYIITISDCVKDTIEELYEMKFRQPVRKNYLGIKPNTLATTKREENDGKIVVFFIGRLERRKGIDSIIASIPQLMEDHPNLEFRMAGDCNIIDDVIGDTYKNKLLKENKRAKWLKRVHFLGKISDEEKEQEFADCDVFVSPSLYESFGIIFIEAMRYAKPVIGCNVGGMKEVISNGETGLLCEPGSAESFATCLDKLLRDASLRYTMGQAGLERLKHMFTEETMCERALEIYREMIRAHK